MEISGSCCTYFAQSASTITHGSVASTDRSCPTKYFAVNSCSQVMLNPRRVLKTRLLLANRA